MAVPVRRDPLTWVVVMVALMLRLAWVAVGARPPRILADPALYYYAALQIACGRGYVSLGGEPCVAGAHPFRTAYYPPGYPYFLGWFQRLLVALGLEDRTVVATGIVQAVLGAVAVVAVVVIGRRLGGRSVGLAAGAVLACWPNLVVYAGLLLSETLFVTAFAVGLAGVLTMDDGGRRHWWRAAAGAGGLGLAALVRPQVLLAVPALALGWTLARVGWREVLRRTAVPVAGVVLLAAPWALRNASVFGAFVPFSTNGGDNLCVGFHPGARGGFSIPDYCDTGDFYTKGPASELRRDRDARARAVRFVRTHPGALPLLSLRKLAITYRTDTDGLFAAVSFGKDQFLGGLFGPLKVVVGTGWTVVVVTALVGAVAAGRAARRRRSDPTAACLLLVTLAGLVVPVLFFGDPRFKVAVAPCLATLAGAGLVALWRRSTATALDDAGPVRAADDGPAPDPPDGAVEDSDRPEVQENDDDDRAAH